MKKTFYIICVLLVVAMGIVLWQALKLIAYAIGIFLTGMVIGWFLCWLHFYRKGKK